MLGIGIPGTFDNLWLYYHLLDCITILCLQCFDAVVFLRQEGHPACKETEWWGVGMVICLERIADLHMSQLMPLPLTVSC